MACIGEAFGAKVGQRGFNTTKERTHMLSYRSVWMLAKAASIFFLLAASSFSQTVSIANEAGSSFKAAKRVVISQFGVEFYTQFVGIGRSGGNTATQTTVLSGVSDITMQTLVDKLYNETITKLKAAGFDILDPDVLKVDAQYQGLVKDYGKTSPYVVHDSQGLGGVEQLSKLVAPSGMPAFYASGGSSGGYVRANMSDRLDSQNYGIGTREADIARRLDATLLKFNFLANYGTTKASKNGLLATFANTAARVSIEPGAVLMPFETQLQFVNADGPRMFGNVKRAGQSGAFYLDQPLAGDNVFQITDTTSADAKSDDNVKNAIFGLLGGGKNAVKTQVLEVKTDDTSYATAYSRLLTAADDALIRALK